MAVADAVVAANVLVPAFDRGAVTPADLAAIQGRRALPVALVQGVQATIGCRMSRPGLLAAGVVPGLPPPSAAELTLAEATAARLRRSGRAVARSFAFGVLPPRLAPAVRARVARTMGVAKRRSAGRARQAKLAGGGPWKPTIRRRRPADAASPKSGTVGPDPSGKVSRSIWRGLTRTGHHPMP